LKNLEPDFREVEDTIKAARKEGSRSGYRQRRRIDPGSKKD
jgi:hypothetical protein